MRMQGLPSVGGSLLRQLRSRVSTPAKTTITGTDAIKKPQSQTDYYPSPVNEEEAFTETLSINNLAHLAR